MKKITLLIACLLTVFLANAQLTSVAIVGNGTTQGWPVDPQTDAHQMATVDNVNWTLNNFQLLNGAIKFRGNNSWALPYNWGGTTFPNGTATIDGPGIASTPGIYDITFNSATGVYSCTLSPNSFPIIGMVGTATAGGWETDTDMATLDGILYTKNGVLLVAGALKFRQDHAWTPTTNWGGTNFPSGTGIVDGDAITVPSDGMYDITFNRTTFAYTFSFPTAALVGDATPQGWPVDPQTDTHQFTTTDGVNYTLNSITLINGAAKIRLANSWGANWGGTTFPAGTGLFDSTSNIPVTAGTYSVTFNRTTLAYNFGAPLAVGEFSSSVFKVYPNPTQGLWNFSSENDKIQNITILDLTGKIVLYITADSNLASIDASGLSAGVYFAKVATSSATDTLKLIKK